MTLAPASRTDERRRWRSLVIGTAPVRAISRGRGGAVEKPRPLMASLGRRLVVAGAVVGLVLIVSSTPAAAVTTIHNANHVA